MINYKILTCLFCFLLSNNLSVSKTADSNILYCSNNIRIKDLVSYTVSNNKYLAFSIIFYTFNCDGSIYLTNKAVDSGSILRPSCKVDSRQGMQYQLIEISLSPNFLKSIIETDPIRVFHKNTLLFSFNTEKYFGEYKISYLNESNLKSNGLFERKLCIPMIRNSRIEYPSEVLDLRDINLKAIKRYYYGRFPMEFIKIKYKTDYFGDYSYKEFPTAKGFEFYVDLKLIHKTLFSSYRGMNTYGSGGLIFEYNNPTYNNSHIIPAFSESEKYVTFKDGRMENANITHYIKEYKPSKEPTYPITDFEKNYELAKNMEIGFTFSIGYCNEKIVHLNFRMDMKKDFYFNHYMDYSLESSFSNEELDTMDIIYA